MVNNAVNRFVSEQRAEAWKLNSLGCNTQTASSLMGISEEVYKIYLDEAKKRRTCKECGQSLGD